MIDSQLPCVLIISDFVNSDSFVKQILKTDNLPDSSRVDNIEVYPWKIDTKYYTATVNLCPMKVGDEVPDVILSLTEALVLYFDSHVAESFENVRKWSNKMKECLPEVLLLVCDSFENIPSGGISKNTTSDWCLHNGYELITLNDIDEDVEEDDYNIILDKKGVERVVEALHTHMWSNLNMKAKSNGIHTNDPMLDSDMFDGDENSEDFCELFSQLHSMKESIQSLPLRDRRACAEQVVSTFWKAIGGDDDEIENDD